MKLKSNLFDEIAIKRAIVRIAHEVTEKNEDTENVCIVGIKTRGVPIAERLANELYKIEGRKFEVETLDISFYRDDLTMQNGDEPTLNKQINFEVTGKNVILVDDVIYTGRTARAALDAVLSNGRAAKIQLAVLVDRGHRELPIRPDYVGKNVPTSKNEVVRVSLTETDGEDSINLYDRQ